MAVGHIKLGAVGSTLKDYVLIDEHRYRKVTANPYSAKISTGGGTYDDLEPFAYWLQTDWQSGIGHRNPDEGLLFSTAETRVPNQIILPQMPWQSDSNEVDYTTNDCRNIGLTGGAAVLTISSTGTYRRIAIKIDPTGSATDRVAFAFYGYVPSGTIITVKLHASTVGGTEISSTTLTSLSTFPGYQWYTAVTTNNLSAYAVPSYFEFYTTSGSFEVVCTGQNQTGGETQVYDGATWSTITGNVYPVFTSNLHALVDASNDPLTPTTAIVKFNGTLYAGMGKWLVKYNAGTGVWSKVSTVRGGNITDLQVWGTTLHVAQDSGNYDTLSTSDVYTTAGVTRSLFAKWNGYLWSKWGHNLYYAADGVTWSSAIPVGHAGSTITGMAGAGDVLYVATTEALYYIAPGDIAVGVTRWGSLRDTNGTSLINHQGQLYCIVDGGLAQISISGGTASILPIWVNKDDDLVADYLAQPLALASTNNWLVALTQQTSSPYKSSVWCWTGQGWHFLNELPLERCDALYYDHSLSSYLWVGSRAGVLFRFRVPDYAVNPVNDSLSRFTSSAWVETGWISGGLKDVTKDWESVYINGDTLNSDQYVEVYYKSSRTGSWTYLGKIDDYGEELRWSDYTTRPASKELKLGFRLWNTSVNTSTDIDVIRLKFLPNVNDRWQWTLPISVSPAQEFVDGTRNANTVAQMMAHLDSLVKSTPPFLLQDLDGTQYEVVCTGASVDVARLDYYNGAKVPYYVYTLNLEQVRGAAYS